jgi:hypothetical protein
MCIKLTRHFQCSAEAEHECEYLIRCSNPDFMLGDMVPVVSSRENRQSRLCEEDPEVREDWYEEPCPKCTGAMDVPLTPAVRVLERGLLDIENEDENPDDDDGIAKAEEYIQNLAYWMYASMCSPGSPLAQAGEEMPRSQDERQMGVLNELICKVDPSHGSPWRLQRDADIGFIFLTPADGCDCLATQNPWLSN